jgi:uncharacterized linocin/CFP29 family protein
MNGNLGRDRIWNDHIWSEIDKAVREEVGRIRVAQKVFPSSVVNNVLPVATTRAVAFGQAQPPPAPLPDQFQPFFEISSEFVLTQAQVDGEENAHLARSRARLAASAVANAEDTILFLGPGSIASLRGVAVTNRPPAPPQPTIPPEFATIPPGFVAEAAAYPPAVSVVGATPLGAPPVPPPFVGDIITAVALGMANLSGTGQPGPYALFVPANRYAQAFAPPVAALQSPGDQIKNVVTGGFYMVPCLTVRQPLPSPPPPDVGILVSLGGEPVKIIIGTDATTAFTSTDPQGNYHFRVFERIQMVVQDGRAFQTLSFP